MFSKLRARYEGSFVAAVIDDASDNDIFTRAAALALYSLMSVFPFIALLVWASTLNGSTHEAHLWASRLSLFLPPDFADLINQEIQYRLDHPLENFSLQVVFHMIMLTLGAGAALRSLLFSFRLIADAEEAIGLINIIWRSILFIVPVIFFVFIASLLVGVVSYLTFTLTTLLNSNWMLMPLLWLAMTGILATVLNGVYASSFIGHQSTPIHGWMGAGVGASLISVVTIGLTTYYEINPVQVSVFL